MVIHVADLLNIPEILDGINVYWPGWRAIEVKQALKKYPLALLALYVYPLRTEQEVMALLKGYTDHYVISPVAGQAEHWHVILTKVDDIGKLLWEQPQPSLATYRRAKIVVAEGCCFPEFSGLGARSSFYTELVKDKQSKNEDRKPALRPVLWAPAGFLPLPKGALMYVKYNKHQI